MGSFDPPGLFLGCMHERFETKLPNGVGIRDCRYNMEHYLRTTVAKYIKMVKDTTSTEPIMTRVPNPCLPEDLRDAPCGKNITEFPAVVRLHCDKSFPVREIGKDRCGFCPGRCLPQDLKTKLPFGSPIYMNETELPLQQVQDVQARALVMSQLDIVASTTDRRSFLFFSEDSWLSWPCLF